MNPWPQVERLISRKFDTFIYQHSLLLQSHTWSRRIQSPSVLKSVCCWSTTAIMSSSSLSKQWPLSSFFIFGEKTDWGCQIRRTGEFPGWQPSPLATCPFSQTVLTFSITRNRNPANVINFKLPAYLNCTCAERERCNSSPPAWGRELLNQPPYFYFSELFNAGVLPECFTVYTSPTTDQIQPSLT